VNISRFLNEPLSVGGTLLPNRLVLAPVDSVFDAPCRGLFKEFGPGLTVGEILNSQTVLQNIGKASKILTPWENETPFAVQLADHDPGRLYDAVKLATDTVDRIDFIDFNMGCPSRNVVKSGNGVAMMKTPELAGACVEALVKASPVPVTVKMRTGWESDEPNAELVARICVDAGASMVTVHGRPYRQGFSGPVNYEIIAGVVDAVDVPVIGNGGIKCVEDAQAMITQGGCHGVMVATGAFGNPWLLSSLMAGEDTAPTVHQRFDIMIEHLKRSVHDVGPTFGVLRMRKHLAWYMKGLPGAAAARRSVMTIADMGELIDYLDGYRSQIVEQS